jgi:NHLM bacteriocin system ABC transporter peptidase/ATP-binding protein
MEAVECGAAALAMIMAHHGLFAPLEQLRIDCGISRDGSKASNLFKAARKYGFECQGKRIHDIQKLETGPLPCIVFWDFNHFLVLEGFGKHKVFLNDPASGARSVTREDFDQSYTGIALYIKPGESFRKGGELPGVYRALLGRLRKSGIELLFVVLVGLLLVIPGLVIPAFTRTFIDEILLKGQPQWLNPLLWGLGLAVCVQGFLVWLQQYHLLRLETKLAVSMAGRFLWHVLRLPTSFFGQRFSGEIGSRVMLNDQLAQMLSGELATNVINLFMMVFYLAVMLRYDVVLTCIGVFFAVTNFVLLTALSRMRTDTNRRLQMDGGKLTGVSMAGVQMIESLKAGGTESDFFARWAGCFTKVQNGEMKLAVPSHVLATVPALLNGLNTTAMLSLGAMRVMDGGLTIGGLVAFQTLMAGFMTPVNTLLQMGTRLQEVRGKLDRLEDVLHYEVDPLWKTDEAGESIPAREEKTRLEGHLELREVTFGYSPLDAPLIENFSMRLTPGMRVALVGASGSGKSTVARLIAGLYRPWSGRILFDGIPREEIPREILSNSLAMVDQEIVLFEGSPKDNLTLWDATIPERQMVEAAKDSCIHDCIAVRPGGYDNRLEEGGLNFSGGERQRLEIARALTVNPRILILDEATSSLDSITEASVDRNLRRRGCTCVVVAHRLSTIRDCDEIIVMDRGKIVERGVHDDLVRQGGLYARLIEY